MRIPDPLAYEIRRLGTLIAYGRDQSDHAAPSPGELAKQIATKFELRSVDVDIALAVLAAELDDEFRQLLHQQHGLSELGVIAAVLPSLDDRLAACDAVGRDAPAVDRGLIRRAEIDGRGVLFPTRRFRAAVYGRPLLAELPEYAVLIERLPAGVPWVTPPLGLTDAMRQTETGGVSCIVLGGVGVGKTSWACRAAFDLAGAALRIDIARGARTGASIVAELRELIEDAAMLGHAIVLDNARALLGNESGLGFLVDEILQSTNAKIFLVLGDLDGVAERVVSRAVGVVSVDAPGPEHRKQLWGVSETSDPMLATVAEDLVLTPRQIQNARRMIAAGTSPEVAAFQQLARGSTLTLPDRSTATLEALVLPTEVLTEVTELIDAIRARGTVARALGGGRGKAITALFDGDSGTGKTFTCEVVAAEVGLPLMQVNVASLVDKYIGETEKNLTRVFQQAQARGGILFFDEADALFGTRTDVSRAQDRYANLETNLLLQLMEQFSGVVLLTTNLKKNIDSAFMRRITFKVYFESPEAPERERLWRTVLPTTWFAERIEFRRLAERFELSGGSIRAALLRAAYRSVAASRKIEMHDLVECAQLETQSMGRVATWK